MHKELPKTDDITSPLLILSVGCLAPDGISVKSLEDGRALFLVAESMKTKHSLCSSFQKTSRSLEKQFPKQRSTSATITKCT